MVSSLSEAGTGGVWPFRTRHIIFFMASSSLANCLAAAGSSASLADTIVVGRSLVWLLNVSYRLWSWQLQLPLDLHHGCEVWY